KNETIWKEKNAIAIADGKHVFAIGDEAYEMYEKTPENIMVAFPMKDGVISRFNDMQYLLQTLLKNERQLTRGAEYVVAVPTDVTEVEKRAFFDLVVHSNAKAREVNIVERGIADAIGLGLDVIHEKGIFIVNFGGETTDLSILSSGGMVLNRLLKIGGATYDTAVATRVRNNYDFLIGRLTSELLRKRLGVFDDSTDTSMIVAGRNLISGVPKQMEIPISLVRAAVKEPLEECVRAMMSLIERTPPEVLSSIQKNGIYVTGGIANLHGLANYLEGATGYKITIAPNPELCVIEGLKKIISSKELKKMAYSMLDESYGWMR
ncbi:MAG: rod shape-determining protein, partial [Lachnospiraceae bacterium]